MFPLCHPQGFDFAFCVFLLQYPQGFLRHFAYFPHATQARDPTAEYGFVATQAHDPTADYGLVATQARNHTTSP